MATRDIIYTSNDFTLNPTLWLKADKGIHLSGNTIYQWDDQTGNGYNAIQLTGTSQPLYVENFINGKPALKFDGVNDFLNLSSPILRQPFSMFFVVQTDSLDNGQSIFFSEDTDIIEMKFNYADFRLYLGQYGVTQTVDTYSNYIINTNCKGGLSNAYINNVYYSGALDSTNIPAGTKIGKFSSMYYSSYISEIIIYENILLIDSELQVIMKYLNTKYNIY